MPMDLLFIGGGTLFTKVNCCSIVANIHHIMLNVINFSEVTSKTTSTSQSLSGKGDIERERNAQRK